MANNHESHHCGGSKFMTGLMWGAIIGGGLVFLLGTPKGKKIIKALSEEGLVLSELLGDDEEEEIEEVIVRQKPPKKVEKVVEKVEDEETEESLDHQEPVSNGVHKPSNGSKIASVHRRFFRGAPKR